MALDIKTKFLSFIHFMFKKFIAKHGEPGAVAKWLAQTINLSIYEHTTNGRECSQSRCITIAVLMRMHSHNWSAESINYFRNNRPRTLLETVRLILAAEGNEDMFSNMVGNEAMNNVIQKELDEIISYAWNKMPWTDSSK